MFMMADADSYNSTREYSIDKSEILLKFITDEAVRKRMPCIIYIGIVSILGIIGNLHVIVVFSRPDIKPSTYTIFVKTLAIIDFTACCVQMPLEIYDLNNPYTFYNKVGCKLFRCLNQLVQFLSDFTLLLIAFDRYRRISKPLKTQMSINKSKRLCLLVLFLSIIIAIPMYVISGHNVVQLEVNYWNVTRYINGGNNTGNGNDMNNSGYSNGGNLTGFMCYFSDDVNGSLLVYIYTSCLVIWYFISVITLTSTYLSILQIVFNRNKGQRRTNSIDRHTMSVLTARSQIYSVSSVQSTNSDVVIPSTEKIKVSTVKTTRSFVLITGIFIITFTPVLILSCVISFDSGFKENLSNTEFGLYQIGIRLLFVNNVANPFVYGFTDQRFKDRIQSFYWKLWKRK